MADIDVEDSESVKKKAVLCLMWNFCYRIRGEWTLWRPLEDALLAGIDMEL